MTDLRASIRLTARDEASRNDGVLDAATSRSMTGWCCYDPMRPAISAPRRIEGYLQMRHSVRMPSGTVAIQPKAAVNIKVIKQYATYKKNTATTLPVLRPSPISSSLGM